MPRYLLQEGELLRFWELDRHERAVVQRWGTGGVEEGRSREEHRTLALAKEAVRRLVGERTARGWQVANTDARREPVKPLRTAPPMEALERAIEADPEASGPWRVYLDWLQQHGDPRGELGALQHRGATRAQVESFVADHRHHLLGPLESVWSGDGLRLQWRWGFIRHATVLGTPSLELGELTRLLLALPACRFLRSLDIGHPLVDQALGPLAESERAKGLERLALSGQSWFSNVQVQPALDACVHLRELSVRHFSRGPLRHPTLELLAVASPVGAELQSTLALSELPALQVLSLLPQLRAPPLGPVLGRRFPALELLQLVGDRYAPALFDSLEGVGLHQRLRELRLSHPARAVVEELAQRLPRWSALERVELAGRFPPALTRALAADPRVALKGRASTLRLARRAAVASSEP